MSPSPVFLSNLPDYIVGTGFRGVVEVNPQDWPFVQSLDPMLPGVTFVRTGLVARGTARLAA